MDHFLYIKCMPPSSSSSPSPSPLPSSSSKCSPSDLRGSSQYNSELPFSPPPLRCSSRCELLIIIIPIILTYTCVFYLYYDFHDIFPKLPHSPANNFNTRITKSSQGRGGAGGEGDRFALCINNPVLIYGYT